MSVLKCPSDWKKSPQSKKHQLNTRAVQWLRHDWEAIKWITWEICISRRQRCGDTAGFGKRPELSGAALPVTCSSRVPTHPATRPGPPPALPQQDPAARAGARGEVRGWESKWMWWGNSHGKAKKGLSQRKASLERAVAVLSAGGEMLSHGMSTKTNFLS